MNNKIKFSTRALTEVALTVALISVCAMISLPLPIPITMQICGVYFALFFLGGRLGTIAVFVYLLLGMIGIPVFAGFTGGIARLFDASGGFILGLLLSALLFWLLEYLLPKRPAFSAVAAALALLLLYVAGSLWYGMVHLGSFDFITVISVCVLPFIIPDAIKIFLAYILAKRLRNAITNIQRKE